MLIEGILTSAWTLWVSGLLSTSIFAIAVWFLITRYRPHLRRIPGPFWASGLPFDRLRTAISGQQQFKQVEYHRKYGPCVRVGPNHISFSSAGAIDKIYNVASKFRKSNFYCLFDGSSAQGKISSLFSICDNDAHRVIRRSVANAYSMSSMIELEPATDICIKIFEDQMRELQGQNIDLGMWLQWYAFDVITSITFSKRLGFMETRRDLGGIIRAIEGRLAYNSVVGEMPYLHHLLLGNAVVARIFTRIPRLAQLNSSRYITDFAAEQLKKHDPDSISSGQPRDMVTRFQKAREDGTIMADRELLRHAISNIRAGSDTTAISLRSMFYYLCKNQRCMDKLSREITDFNSRGELSNPVKFEEASRMPYLQACMKEAMRLHPAVGQLLERVVPEGGVNVDGFWLPAGTVVGVNPWVAGRDQSVYGEDADMFRPERWIEADAATSKMLDKSFLAFGAGARTCLGKNISLLEMSKLVPQILRHWDVELSDPDATWTLTNHWLVKQTGLICSFRERKQALE